jgi:hypothetical protein
MKVSSRGLPASFSGRQGCANWVKCRVFGVQPTWHTPAAPLNGTTWLVRRYAGRRNDGHARFPHLGVRPRATPRHGRSRSGWQSRQRQDQSTSPAPGSPSRSPHRWDSSSAVECGPNTRELSSVRLPCVCARGRRSSPARIEDRIRDVHAGERQHRERHDDVNAVPPCEQPLSLFPISFTAYTTRLLCK